MMVQSKGSGSGTANAVVVVVLAAAGPIKLRLLFCRLPFLLLAPLLMVVVVWRDCWRIVVACAKNCPIACAAVQLLSLQAVEVPDR